MELKLIKMHFICISCRGNSLNDEKSHFCDEHCARLKNSFMRLLIILFCSWKSARLLFPPLMLILLLREFFVTIGRSNNDDLPWIMANTTQKTLLDRGNILSFNIILYLLCIFELKQQIASVTTWSTVKVRLSIEWKLSINSESEL